jgi:phage shock protein A
MPNSQDYRDMVAQRFTDLTILMNAHFMNVKDSLDSIKKDTQLTNSRVNHLEEDLVKLEEKTDKAIAEGKHIIDTRGTECPNIIKFEKLDKRIDTTIDLIDVRHRKLDEKWTEEIKEINNAQKSLSDQLVDGLFFVRHPKLLIGSIIVLVILVSIVLAENTLPGLIKLLTN